MPNNYPLFYKKLVINQYNSKDMDLNINEFVNRYNISVSILYNWLNKSNNGESLEKKKVYTYIKIYPNNQMLYTKLCD